MAVGLPGLMTSFVFFNATNNKSIKSINSYWYCFLWFKSFQGLLAKTLKIGKLFKKINLQGNWHDFGLSKSKQSKPKNFYTFKDWKLSEIFKNSKSTKISSKVRILLWDQQSYLSGSLLYIIKTKQKHNISPRWQRQMTYSPKQKLLPTAWSHCTTWNTVFLLILQ